MTEQLTLDITAADAHAQPWTDDTVAAILRTEGVHCLDAVSRACACGWTCPPNHSLTVMHAHHRAEAILAALLLEGALRPTEEQQAARPAVRAILVKVAGALPRRGHVDVRAVREELAWWADDLRWYLGRGRHGLPLLAVSR